jgi:hypothetical protein
MFTALEECKNRNDESLDDLLDYYQKEYVFDTLSSEEGMKL